MYQHPVGEGWGLSPLSPIFKTSKSSETKKYHIFEKSIFKVIFVNFQVFVVFRPLGANLLLSGFELVSPLDVDNASQQLCISPRNDRLGVSLWPSGIDVHL